MKSTPAEIGRIISALEGMPARLEALAAGQAAERLAARIEVKEWSAQELLAHLRACADLWTGSIYAMLAEKDPVLPDIDERKYARAARYAETPFRTALRAFTLQREELVRVLYGLKPGDWERGAVINARRHTVFTQVRRLVKHEDVHVKEIAARLR